MARKQRTVNLTDEQLLWVTQQAEYHKRSISWIISDLIEQARKANIPSVEFTVIK